MTCVCVCMCMCVSHVFQLKTTPAETSAAHLVKIIKKRNMKALFVTDLLLNTAVARELKTLLRQGEKYKIS